MPARPDAPGDREPIAVFGVPRKPRGRYVRAEVALIFSTYHLPLDLSMYCYLRGLGGKGMDFAPKHPGIPSLCRTFDASDSTIRRSLERLATEYGELHPAYITRTRAGRRKGQTMETTVVEHGITRDIPWGLLTDVTTRMLDPRDFQVWCAIEDMVHKPNADGRRPPPDGLLRFALTDVLDALGSTNTSNPRWSFVYESVRRLEQVGWLVVANSPGVDNVIAVPLQRLERVDRDRIAATLNAARPAFVHTRHRHDRLSPNSMGTNPPAAGDQRPSDVDSPVDNPDASLHTHHPADRPTRHRDDRAKEHAGTASTQVLKKEDQAGPQPPPAEPTAGASEPARPRPVDSPRPPLVPVLPLIPRPRSRASAGRSRANRRRSTPRHPDP